MSTAYPTQSKPHREHHPEHKYTIDYLEEIVETLEDSEIGLETAKKLREEADEHLEALRERLDVGDGEIIEIDSEDVDLEQRAPLKSSISDRIQRPC